MPKAKKTPGLVFDDDTSDSDDELDAFRKNIKKVVKENNPDLEDSDDDEFDDEDASDDDDDEDDDEDDDQSRLQEKDDSHIKAKLGKLGSMLDSLQNNEESSDDDEDDDDDDSDNMEEDDEHNQPEPSDAESEINNEESNLVSKTLNKDSKSLKRPAEGRKEDAKKPKILSEEEERVRYKNQLSKLSVEEILKIKNSLGDKDFNNKWAGGKKTKEKALPVFKRDNKNRPREVSSKKRVPKLVKVVQETKEVKRDPRFDPLCGEFDKDQFRKSYNFVNRVKEKELEVLKSQLKGSAGEEREKLKYLIQRHENQLRSEKQRSDQEKVEIGERRERKEMLIRGEKPVFKTKKIRREEELVSAYEGLKEKGGLDNFIKKKNKKNTARDRKNLGKAYENSLIK